MAKTESAQLLLSSQEGPKPTGDLWELPSKSNPVSVPVPLPVVMVRVEGHFTALDRKLWLILLQHAWADLEAGKALHSISISELLRLFRQHGRHDLGTRGALQITKAVTEESHAVEVWSSVRRLVVTRVEWEDEDYKGVGALLADALMSKQHRQSGWLNYSFGANLSKNLLLPRMFARLRTHFMLGLRSKYAITLYEILEAYANRKHPICTVDLDDLQNWMKVPATAYPDWRELKKRVIEPAVREINEHAEDAGFMVDYEGVREGRAFTKITFTVTKTDGRTEHEAVLGRKAKIYKRRAKATAGIPDPDNPPMPSGDAIDTFRAKWPGNDPHDVINRFQDKWRADGFTVIRSPDGAFLKFAEGMFKARAKKGRAAA
jgi:hypothetical protein